MVAAVVAFPTVASAQTQGFSAQRFFPLPAQRANFLSLYGGRVPGAFEWDAGLFLNVANGLLVETDADGEEVSTPVSSLVALDLVGSIGLIDRLEIGFDIPMYVSQGSSTSGEALIGDPDASFGLGDIRLLPKVQLWTNADAVEGEGAALAFVLPLHLPTGDEAVFQGAGFQVRPTVAFDVALGAARLGTNLGYIVRPHAEIVDPTGVEDEVVADIDDAFAWGIAAEISAAEPLDLLLEVEGEARTGAATDASGSPIEGRIGAQIHIGSRTLTHVAFGRGLSSGWGAPNWRLVLGATYGFKPDPDRDDDEFLNADDACPDQAEDYDGFEDDDGCPEADNDQDGLPDLRDTCPNRAEDEDGFEDDDGCPDDDNDGDGIADATDTCPDEAEDVDGFEDTDGCPDLDNDQDGIADADDQCADAAEDMDGFEDTDGCPELDNDNDGVLDADDQCADEPEMMNGVDDGDGCPDEAAVVIRPDQNLIEALQPLTFTGTSATLSSSGSQVADDLAVALAAYPNLRVRIVVRSRDRGSEDARIDISQRRGDAIVEVLTGAGIDAGRLSVGAYALDDDAPGDADVEVELRLQR